jgi:hypothetical protein
MVSWDLDELTDRRLWHTTLNFDPGLLLVLSS